ITTHALELPVRFVRNPVHLLEHYRHLAQSVSQPIRNFRFRTERESIRRRVTNADAVERFLNDLRLANREAVKDRIDPVHPSAVARNQKIVRSPLYAGEERQRASTATRLIFSERTAISNCKADERHVGIQQTSAHKSSRHASRHSAIFLIAKHLEMPNVGPQVQRSVLAFTRGSDELGHTICLSNGAPKRPLDHLALPWENRLCVSDQNAKPFQAKSAKQGVGGERCTSRGVRNQMCHAAFSHRVNDVGRIVATFVIRRDVELVHWSVPHPKRRTRTMCGHYRLSAHHRPVITPAHAAPLSRAQFIERKPRSYCFSRKPQLERCARGPARPLAIHATHVSIVSHERLRVGAKCFFTENRPIFQALDRAPIACPSSCLPLRAIIRHACCGAH